MVVWIDPYRFASGGDAGTSPDAISGLEAWWDASDTGTITASSGNVSAVSDKSGNGNTLSVGGSTGNITTGTASLNGLNLLAFDSGDKYLYTGSGFTNIESNRALTVAIVNRIDQAADSLFSLPKIAGQDHQTFFLHQWNSSQIEMTMGDGATYATAADLLSKFYDTATGQYRLTVARVNTSGWSMREDGVDLSQNGSSGSMSISSFLATSTGDMHCRVGARAHSSGNYAMEGKVAEACLYSAYLTGDDLTGLETFLMNKWGL